MALFAGSAILMVRGGRYSCRSRCFIRFMLTAAILLWPILMCLMLRLTQLLGLIQLLGVIQRRPPRQRLPAAKMNCAPLTCKAPATP